MARKGGGKKFMIGAALGTLIGGVTALMFAPKSGKKMRKDMKKACCDVKDKSEEVLNKAKKMAKDVKKSGRSISRRVRK